MGQEITNVKWEREQGVRGKARKGVVDDGACTGTSGFSVLLFNICELQVTICDTAMVVGTGTCSSLARHEVDVTV